MEDGKVGLCIKHSTIFFSSYIRVNIVGGEKTKGSEYGKNALRWPSTTFRTSVPIPPPMRTVNAILDRVARFEYHDKFEVPDHMIMDHAHG